MLTQLLLTSLLVAALSAASAAARNELTSSRHRRDVPDILLPDSLHDGRKRAGGSASAGAQLLCRELMELLRRRLGPEDGPELACRWCLQLRALQQAADAAGGLDGRVAIDKRFLDSLVRPGSIYSGRRKRFLDSLVRPHSIYSGRKKRFLDSLVRPGSIYSGRRKRFFDSLVRPGSIYNGKRAYVGDGGDGEFIDTASWCPV